MVPKSGRVLHRRLLDTVLKYTIRFDNLDIANGILVLQCPSLLAQTREPQLIGSVKIWNL